MSFISASTAAIFSADEGCGRPNPRKDMLSGDICRCADVFGCGGRGDGAGGFVEDGQM